MTIETKHLGPTNSRGARIRAKHVGTGKSIVIPYPHELDLLDAHIKAFETLCAKHNYAGKYAYGWSGNGYIFIPITEVIRVE